MVESPDTSGFLRHMIKTHGFRDAGVALITTMKASLRDGGDLGLFGDAIMNPELIDWVIMDVYSRDNGKNEGDVDAFVVEYLRIARASVLHKKKAFIGAFRTALYARHKFYANVSVHSPQIQRITGPFVDDIVSEFVLSEECLGKFLEMVTEYSFDISVCWLVFVLVGSNAGLKWTEERVKVYAGRIQTALEHLNIWAVECGVRSIDDDYLVNIMEVALEFSTRAKLPEMVRVVLDMGLFYMKGEILKKQLIGADMLCFGVTRPDASELITQWVRSREFIPFLVEKDLHEKILERMTPYFGRFLVGEVPTGEVIRRLWDRMERCHAVQRQGLSVLMFAVFRKLDSDEVKGFISYIVESGKMPLDNMRFLCSAALSDEDEISEKIISFFIELRKEPETESTVDHCMMYIVKSSPKVYVRNLLCRHFTLEFASEQLKPSTVLMMKTLLEQSTSKPSFCSSYKQFLTNIRAHVNVDHIFELLSSMLMKFSGDLCEEDVVMLFDIIAPHPKAWLKIINVIEGKRVSMGKNATEKLWQLILDVPASSEFVCPEMMSAVAALALASACDPIADIPGTSCSVKRRVSKIPCIGLDWLLQVYKCLDIETDQSAFQIGMTVIMDLIGSVNECPLEMVATFLIDAFRGAVTESEKINVLRLAESVLFLDYEKNIDVQEFGFRRHTYREVQNHMPIMLRFVRFQTDVICVNTSKDSKVRELRRLIGMRIGCPASNLLMTSDGLTMLDGEFLDNYRGVRNGGDVVVEVLGAADVKSPGREDIMSYHLTPLVGDLLDIMKEDGYSKLQVACCSFARALATDPILASEATNDIIAFMERIKTHKSAYTYVMYMSQILVNDDCDVDAYISMFIDLCLDDESVPLPCFIMLLQLIAECTTEAVLYRESEMWMMLVKIVGGQRNPSACEICIKTMSLLVTVKPSSIDDECIERLVSVFLEVSEEIAAQLVHIISVLPEREKIFDMLVGVYDQVSESKLKVYVSALGKMLTSECNTDTIIGKCVENLGVKGVCGFLVDVMNLSPSRMACQPRLLSRLINSAFSDGNRAGIGEIFHMARLLVQEDSTLVGEIKDNILSRMSIVVPNAGYQVNSMEERGEMVGLKNLGATCYFNSVLQQLFHNHDVRRHILTHGAGQEGWKRELSLLFAHMADSVIPVADTSALCAAFKFPGSDVMNTHIQQDATELFQFLMDHTDDELQKLYSVVLVNTIEGVTEEFQSQNREHFFSLCLPVKGFEDFNQSFSSLITEELFTGDNQYFADTIGHKIDARKYAKIESAGPYLVLQLKRFEYDLDTWNRYKVDDYMKFPNTFDIAPYTTNLDTENIYHLTGVIIHMGTVEGGHYISAVKNGDQWYTCNDGEIGACTEERLWSLSYGDDVRSQTRLPSAYMLFYAKTPEKKYTDEICSELSLYVSKENETYMVLQSLFHPACFDFICALSDPEILTTFLIRVFCYLPHELFRIELLERIKGLMDQDAGVLQACWNVIDMSFSAIIDVFIKCYIPIFAVSLILFIAEVIKSVPVAMTVDWLEGFIDNMQWSFKEYRQLPYFGKLLYECVSGNEEYMAEALKRRWPDKILDILCQFYADKIPNCGDADVSVFLSFLSMFPEAHHSIDKLTSISNEIMRSGRNACEFMAFTLKQPCELTQAVIRNGGKGEMAERMNIFAEILLGIEKIDDAHEMISRARMTLCITDDILRLLCVGAIDMMDIDIQRCMRTYGGDMIMALLMSPSSLCPSSAEGFCHSLFPAFDWSAISGYDNGLLKLSEQSRLGGGNVCPVGQTNADRLVFNEFWRSCIDYLRFFAYTKSDGAKSKTESERFVCAFRVMQCMLRNDVKATPDDLLTVFNLIKVVRNQSFAPDLNAMEGVRLLGAIPEPLRSEFLSEHFDDLCGLVFPLDATDNQFVCRQLLDFLSIASCIGDGHLLHEFVETDAFSREWACFRVNSSPEFTRNVTRVLGNYKTFLDRIFVNEINADNNMSFFASFLSIYYDGGLDDGTTFLKINEWFIRQIGSSYHSEDAVLIVSMLKDSSNRPVPQQIWSVMPEILTRISSPNKGYMDYYVKIFCGNQEFSLRLIDVIAKSHDSLGIEHNDDGFWAVHSLFLACLVGIENSEVRQSWCEDYFMKMLDHLDDLRSLEVGECFQYMIYMLQHFEYEENCFWAELATALLLERETIEPCTRPFLIEVIKHLPDSDAIDRYCEHICDASGDDLEEISVIARIDRAILYAEARPDLSSVMMRTVVLPENARDWWPSRRVTHLQQIMSSKKE